MESSRSKNHHYLHQIFAGLFLIMTFHILIDSLINRALLSDADLPRFIFGILPPYLAAGFLSGGVIGVVALVVIYFIYKYFLRPIRDLIDASREIGRGNFNIKINLNGVGGINELATALNQMQEGIMDLSQGMNKKVSQRTRELETVRRGLEEKIGELERFQEVVIDRELKMMELKNEINKLKRNQP